MQTDRQPALDDAPRNRAALRRGLALAWVAIVLAVGACILIASWWNRDIAVDARPSPVDSPAVAAPATTGQPFNFESTTTIPTPVLETNPAATGTPLPVQDTSFGYGVSLSVENAPRESIEQAQQLGMNWVRLTVRWADVQPEPNVYEWETLDTAISDAAARGLRVLLTVHAAPAWARSVTATDLDGPPDQPQLYADFITMLLQRYPGAIHGIEVWQTMNWERAWYAPGGMSSTAYMNLLTPAAEAIHREAPGVLVISGGLIPTGIDDAVRAVDDFRYLRELLDMGLLNVVDCVGARHQGYNLAPDTPYDAELETTGIAFRDPIDNPHHSWSFYSTIRGYHDLIVASGGTGTICVTEFGWPTAADVLGEDPAPAFARDNTLEEQANYLVGAYTLMREWGFVRLGIVSNLDYSDRNDLTVYYRLVSPNGLPRPAFDALATMPKTP